MTEQTPDDPTTQLPPTTPPDVTAAPPAPEAAPVAAAAPARSGSTRTILEIVGAAVAAVLIVAAGITGFAVGALVSDRDGGDDRGRSQDFAMSPERGDGRGGSGGPGGQHSSPRGPGDVESFPFGPEQGGPGQGGPGQGGPGQGGSGQGGPQWGDSQQ
jgi:hypothetical protein